jgi:ribosome-binding protein aMBF1 (putative translation factor)
VSWLSLIRPILIALGLWKVKQAGRDEAEAEQLEENVDALKDRIEADREARGATDDDLARQLRGPRGDAPD